jgi:hypothetical protein
MCLSPQRTEWELFGWMSPPNRSTDPPRQGSLPARGSGGRGFPLSRTLIVTRKNPPKRPMAPPSVRALTLGNSRLKAGLAFGAKVYNQRGNPEWVRYRYY